MGNGKQAVGRYSIQALAYTHDAWQRLVRVEFGSDVRAEYEYNGLNWRTVKRADMQEAPDGTLTQERVMLYDKDWRLVEEWIDDDLDENPGVDRIAQQVWGPRYIDDAILRRQSTNLGNDSPNTTWETRHYYLTDALFSPVALVTHTGALAERVSYTPYGVARHHWAHDVSGDGAVTTDSGDPGSDVSLANDALNETIADSSYNVDADVNRDGVVNSTDVNAITAAAAAALPEGLVSDADAGAGGADSRMGIVSYEYDHEISMYLLRHRFLEPRLGRFARKDPIGDILMLLHSYPPHPASQYVDGMNVLQYAKSSPGVYTDSHGLESNPCRRGDDGDNYRCLSAIIFHEARGQSEACRNAVAWVVYNRTRYSPFWGWPNNICDVVTHPGQFQGVPGGNYSRACKGSACSGGIRPQDQSDWNPITEQMQRDWRHDDDGRVFPSPNNSDPTNGADHFCTPSPGCTNLGERLNQAGCRQVTVPGCPDSVFMFWQCGP